MATPTLQTQVTGKQPIYVRGFELPSDGAYFMDGVQRTITKKAMGTNLRTLITFDVVIGAIPVELYDENVSTTAAGPGEIAGEQQFTVLMQYAPAYWVRATAYGRNASLFRDKVMEAITQKRAFAALADKVQNGEVDEAELTKVPRRILSFGLSGKDRPNVQRQQAGQPNRPQQPRPQEGARRVTTLQSMKLEELFVNYSDGTEEPVFTVGTSPSGANARNDEQYL